MITSIRGLEAFSVNLESLVSDMKKKYACSVSISPIKGMTQESEILVQGTADVRGLLINNLGIPANCIINK